MDDAAALIDMIRKEIVSMGYEVDKHPMDTQNGVIEYHPAAIDIYRDKVIIATIMYASEKFSDFDDDCKYDYERGLYYILGDSDDFVNRRARINIDDPRFMNQIKKMVGISYSMARENVFEPDNVCGVYPK